MGRRCNVHLCESASNRVQDQGVTFHKLPVNENIRIIWLAQCHLPLDAGQRTVYVCSRHFRRADFQTFKGTKYMLKTGSIPSMFAWGRTSDEELDRMSAEAIETKTTNRAVKVSNVSSTLSASTQNVDNTSSNNNINRIQRDKTKENTSDNLNLDNSNLNTGLTKTRPKRPSTQNASVKNAKKPRLTESPNVQEKVSATITSPTKNVQPRSPKKPTTVNGNTFVPNYDLSTMNLVPGSEVEAKDFNDKWTTVKVLEVDNEENEILIEFQKGSNKSDEWIPMNSSRLRPVKMAENVANRLYGVGDRCMAKWTDSRKFPATVRKVLENGQYEILFDDGYIKALPESHISRLPDKLRTPTGVKRPTTPNNKDNAPSITNTPVTRHLTSNDKLANVKIEPQEWCFRWEGDSPVGRPGSIDSADGVKRTTVIVDDPRLPSGWIKHVVKRYTGSSAGKWDIVIVNPHNRKFRTKREIDTYFLESGRPYNPDNFDFCLHRKRAREIGWATSPIKRKRQSVYETRNKVTTPKQEINRVPVTPSTPPAASLEDGYVHVGSLKVQIVDNLFQCPEATCVKSFRKENLLQMHIKHYHPHLTQYLGSTPNVADLAYARTIRETSEPEPIPKNRYSNSQFYEKVAKIDAINKRVKCPISPGPAPIDLIPASLIKAEPPDEPIVDIADIKVSNSPVSVPELKTPKIEKTDEKTIADVVNNSQEAPKPFKSESNCPLLEEALRVDSPKRNLKHHVTFSPDTKPVPQYKEPPLVVQEPPGGGIKRLLPKKPEENVTVEAELDVKPRRSVHKKRELIQSLSKKKERKKRFRKRKRAAHHNLPYEQDENLGINSIDGTRNKNNVWPLLKTESLNQEKPPEVIKVKTESLVEVGSPGSSAGYITEDGEKIKLVRMRREEIINCGCGYTEEDGLMVQCELCLCWQHANCLGIYKEAEVPDRYICGICTTPKGGRTSKMFLNDQRWLLLGQHPSFLSDSDDRDPSLQDHMRDVHEVTGNALELLPVMRTVTAKLAMASQTDHPKFYYWAKAWAREGEEEASQAMGPPTASTSQASTSQASTSKASTSQASTSWASTSQASTSWASTSQASTSKASTSWACTSQASTSKASTSWASTTQPSTSKAFTSQASTSQAHNTPEPSPTLQAIQRGFTSSENESEVLGTQIENEMNRLKSKTITKKSKAMNKKPKAKPTSVSATFPVQETPSRGLNLYSESKDDFTSLVKSDMFDANVDISAILESNDAIPTDSELVSILEGDLKSENDLNSPARLKNGVANVFNSETETDEDGKNELNIDLLSFMASDDRSTKSTKSVKSTANSSVGSRSLLTPILATPVGSKLDLEQSVGQQVLMKSSHPVPEEAIDNQQCRWNILRHVNDHQNHLDSQIDELNNRLENLLQCPEAPGPGVDFSLFNYDYTDLVKMVQRDLHELEQIVTLSAELQKSKKNMPSQSQPFRARSATPNEHKR